MKSRSSEYIANSVPCPWQQATSVKQPERLAPEHDPVRVLPAAGQEQAATGCGPYKPPRMPEACSSL